MTAFLRTPVDLINLYKAIANFLRLISHMWVDSVYVVLCFFILHKYWRRKVLLHVQPGITRMARLFNEITQYKIVLKLTQKFIGMC